MPKYGDLFEFKEDVKSDHHINKYGKVFKFLFQIDPYYCFEDELGPFTAFVGLKEVNYFELPMDSVQPYIPNKNNKELYELEQIRYNWRDYD